MPPPLRVVIRPVPHKVRCHLSNLSIQNVAVVFLCAMASALAEAPRPAPTPSIVFVAHDAKAITDYRENPRIVHAMVDRLVLAVTGQPDVAKAWSSLVAPNDKIGIKISAAGGELFNTHHE